MVTFLSYAYYIFFQNIPGTSDPEESEPEIDPYYRGFLPYATFGTWKKFALASNKINSL